MKLYHTQFCGQVSLIRAETPERAGELARKFGLERLAGRLANAPAERAGEMATQLAAASKPGRECQVSEVAPDGPEERVISFTPAG